MKHYLLTILLLGVGLTAVAQSEGWDSRENCEAWRKAVEAPYYYCDCQMDNHVFSFPLDTVISDTVWYTATLKDLKRGLSAYWFADCSVTMEVYAFCTGKEPIYSLTVGRNQMREVDAEFIQSKIDQAGDKVQELLNGTLKPHMRVYPHNGGSGRVYCYPYDQGPESTCEDPLPLRPGMTYTCEKEENSYKLEYSLIPTSGKAFIHWKQKKNQPCDIWLTLDSCTGEEIGRATLADSLHVYPLDSAKLVDIRKDKRTVWLHVKHAKDRVGRIRFYTNPKYAEELAPVSKSICQGKSLTVNGRSFTQDTTFTDTLWVALDTLQTMNVNLSFTSPSLEFDTVYVSEAELKEGFRYNPSGTLIFEYGDTIVEAVKPNTCTRKIQLTVKKPEAFEYINADGTRTYKTIQNGQLFIIVDERKYNSLGQQTN